MMIEVGELTREVGATAARAIEDELDWEHLPHVPAFAFESIALSHADRNGWDANVVLRDGQAMRMTVALDADRMGYTNATFDLDGTENGRTVCRIAPGEGDHCTMHLRFFVPDRPGLDKAAVGGFYSALWARLIDEDEPKMIHRARALKEGAKLHRERRQVMLADGSAFDVPLVCPHQGLPLTCEPDSGGMMICPWHGYRFDARDFLVAVIFGLAVVGLEYGYVSAFRLGWPVNMTGTMVTAATAVILLPIGWVIFRETLSGINLVGLACCVLGLGLLAHR